VIVAMATGVIEGLARRALHGAAIGRVVTHLDMRPLDSLHRPSVDVLFQSAAEVYHNRVLGVVMTGMGDDGRQGAAWIKSQGGSIFTESEESCVVDDEQYLAAAVRHVRSANGRLYFSVARRAHRESCAVRVCSESVDTRADATPTASSWSARRGATRMSRITARRVSRSLLGSPNMSCQVRVWRAV